MKTEPMRKKIGDIFAGHLETLHLFGYDIFIFMPTDKKWEKPENDSFSVNLNFPYKRVKLFVGEDIIEQWKEVPVEEIKGFLLHEAIHILTWRFGELAYSRFVSKKELMDEEEFLVDSIKNILEDLT